VPFIRYHSVLHGAFHLAAVGIEDHD
jgi:hypothetical protein